MTPHRFPRSLAEAFPGERAYAGFGPYRRPGLVCRLLLAVERAIVGLFR